MSENREKILENLEDIEYTTLWGIEVEKDGSLSNIELRYTTRFPSGSIVSDFSPSETYVRRAKQQIDNMEWSHIASDDGEIREQTVICYIFKSDPDKPQCTNDLAR